MNIQKRNVRLPPEVNRILYVRNLPYKISPEDMYEIFGQFGPIRQIRVGNAGDTKGTAFVVYEDIFDAKRALEHLAGFNVAGRYMIILYYQPHKFQKKAVDVKKRTEDLAKTRAKYGLDEDGGASSK